MVSWFEQAVTALEQCQTTAEAYDVDNDLYIRDNIVGQRITVTSARRMPSEYCNGIYAVIGFTGPDGNGRFSIGGNGARLPLVLSRHGNLPADLILYTAETPHGPIYKWKRADK